MADINTRVTRTWSGVGQLSLLINLPLILVVHSSMSYLGIALPIFAPNIATLMQLGLSRAREYDAYFGAADLTQDPGSVVPDLQKLERLHAGVLQ